MKARIVLRESDDTLKEGYGFTNQREDSIAFAAKVGLEVVQEHQIVERSTVWNRQKFQEVVDEAIRHKDEIPAIVFPRVDRFARNLEAAGYYLGLLRQNGLVVMFAQEALVVDNEASVMEVLMFSIHSFKADQDGRQIKHNLLSGRDKLATIDQEIPNGMVIWPFDYLAKRLHGKINTNGRPTINIERANYVRKWADWIIDEGIGLNEVCQKMNEEGVVTKRGGKFSSKAIRDILRSRQLIGEFRWKGELYLKDDNLSILKNEQFEALQKHIDENRERSYYNAIKHDYPPLRKMVFCGCSTNRKMYGKPVRSTTWYYCPKCKTNIRCQIIWDKVREEIATGLLKEDRLIPAIESQFNNDELITKREQELKRLNDRIAFLNDKWDSLYRLVSSDYPKERFKKRETEITEAINRAKAEQDQTERELDAIRQRRLDEEGIARFCRLVAHNIDNLSKEQWEMLLKIMRLRITVHSKDTITVSVALPPVRETKIEFSRL